MSHATCSTTSSATSTAIPSITCRIIISRVDMKPSDGGGHSSGGNRIHIYGTLAAPSPAVRVIAMHDSATTCLDEPFEGVGPELTFILCEKETQAFRRIRHCLHSGAVYHIVATPSPTILATPDITFASSISLKDKSCHTRESDTAATTTAPTFAGANEGDIAVFTKHFSVVEISLARCAPNGRSIFRLLSLLAPDSAYAPPPLASEAYCVLGLDSVENLATAQRLWLTEGEEEEKEPKEPKQEREEQRRRAPFSNSKKRVQRPGQRLRDQLRRKPLLRQWISQRAIALDVCSGGDGGGGGGKFISYNNVSSSDTKKANSKVKKHSRASRHPLVKTGAIVVAATALKLFGIEQLLPVPCIDKVSAFETITKKECIERAEVGKKKKKKKEEEEEEGVKPNKEAALALVEKVVEPVSSSCLEQTNLPHVASDLGQEQQKQHQPLIDLPAGLDTKTSQRRGQWAERKRPQLCWMLSRMDELVGGSGNKCINVLDVGGGRGDLAVWIGQRRPNWRTIAIDIHSPSVAAGQAAVAAAGLNSRATVLECDAQQLLPATFGADGEKVAAHLGGVCIDIVVGLHCCGGLSETAAAIALAYGASFCICTCCFCSHPHLCQLLPADGDDWARLATAASKELEKQQQQQQQQQQRRNENVILERKPQTKPEEEEKKKNALKKKKKRKKKNNKEEKEDKEEEKRQHQNCVQQELELSAPTTDADMLRPRRPKLNASQARRQLLRCCEREGARATEAAETAAEAASSGLWSRTLAAATETSPQTKSMVAVNGMRLHAFTRAARAAGRRYQTRILSFTAGVSTRNLALVGRPAPQRTLV